MLGIEPTKQFQVVSFDSPSERQKGIIVEDVEALANALKQKGFF